MADDRNLYKPDVAIWEKGPGMTEPDKRLMTADLPTDVSRIGLPLVGDLLSLEEIKAMLPEEDSEITSPMDLVLEVADSLEDAMTELQSAEIRRTEAELDFRFVFFQALSDEERNAVIEAHPRIDSLIGKLNNGYRYTDRSL